MLELERNVIPRLSTRMTKWKRYVDGTITYIKPSSINYVICVLNSFHKNTKFTFEEEKDNKISFLDVLILRNGVLSRQQFTVNLHVMMFIYTWIRFHLTAGK